MSMSAYRLKITGWETLSLFFRRLPISTKRDPYLKKMF